MFGHSLGQQGGPRLNVQGYPDGLRGAQIIGGDAGDHLDQLFLATDASTPYLVQLHGDAGPNGQLRNRLGDVSMLGHGNVLGLGSQSLGVQQGFMSFSGFGASGLNLNAGLSAGNTLSNFAFLQQQQQQQQQLHQLQQQLHHQQQAQLQLIPGPSNAAPLARMPRQMSGFQPPSGQSAGGGAAKPPRARGKGAGKQQVSKVEPDSCTGSESEDNGSEDDARTRKRQATGGDDAERRHQALQEKNRRAQRRFRERQKVKLQELQKQIEDLSTNVSSLQSENASLYSRASVLEKVLDMRNEQIQAMQETKEAAGVVGTEPTMQGYSGKLVQLTPENIKALSPDQIFKIHQMYVKELSVRLGEGGDKQQEVDVLVHDLTSLILRLGAAKPLETRKFIVMSRQHLGSSEVEVIEMWRKFTKSLELTEQQVSDIIDRKRLFLKKIAPVMEERKALNMQIQSNLPQDTFATKNALTYIKAHEAVVKLRENLRLEQRLVLESSMAVFCDVLTPAQTALLLVKCYPAVPDALGMTSALVMDLGDTDLAQARQLTMQLGGYLERPTLMSSGISTPRVSEGGLDSLHGVVAPLTLVGMARANSHGLSGQAEQRLPRSGSGDQAPVGQASLQLQ